jgi:hypothetical protein
VPVRLKGEIVVVIDAIVVGVAVDDRVAAAEGVEDRRDAVTGRAKRGADRGGGADPAEGQARTGGKEGIAQLKRVAAGDPRAFEIGHHVERGRGRVAVEHREFERVVAAAAYQRIGSLLAEEAEAVSRQHVIVVATVDQVAAALAVQEVVASIAEHVVGFAGPEDEVVKRAAVKVCHAVSPGTREIRDGYRGATPARPGRSPARMLSLRHGVPARRVPAEAL